MSPSLSGVHFYASSLIKALLSGLYLLSQNLNLTECYRVEAPGLLRGAAPERAGARACVRVFMGSEGECFPPLMSKRGISGTLIESGLLLEDERISTRPGRSSSEETSLALPVNGPVTRLESSYSLPASHTSALGHI